MNGIISRQSLQNRLDIEVSIQRKAWKPFSSVKPRNLLICTNVVTRYHCFHIYNNCLDRVRTSHVENCINRFLKDNVISGSRLLMKHVRGDYLSAD